MRVLVTGGAGYIGSVVADHLLRGGHSVTVLDNLSKGHREAVPAQAEFILADTGDQPAIDRVFEHGRFDAVMHFAAFIEAGESVLCPEKFFDNNCSRTLTLLQAVLKYRVPRFVLSSTAAVYGEPRRTPIPEDHPLDPTNPYGESKLIVERMLSWFHRVHGLRYASLRYFNAAGATAERGEAHNPETHLIPLVLQVPLGQRPAISIFGTDYPTKDGTCIRDYIHVDDLATAHLLALDGLEEHSQLILQPGKRQRIQRARGHRDRAQGHRTRDSGSGSAAARRRSGGAGGQLRKDSPRAGMEAAALGHREHHSQRVGVA